MEMEMVDREFEEAVMEANEGRFAAAATDEGLGATLARLAAAAGALEQVIERMRAHEPEDAQATIERVVATVEARREGELERRLEAAEAELAEVRAQASQRAEVRAAGQRKTVPVAVTHLLAKQGVSLESMGGESMQAGALDAALASLSVEQRIAVKAQLLRAGVLG